MPWPQWHAYSLSGNEQQGASGKPVCPYWLDTISFMWHSRAISSQGHGETNSLPALEKLQGIKKHLFVTHLTLLKPISWLSVWRVLLWPTPGRSVTHTIASGAPRPACRDSGGHVYTPGQPVGFILNHIPTSPGRVTKIPSREHQPHHIILLVPGTQTPSMICFHIYISVHLWM